VFRTTRQSADAQRLSNNRKKGEVGRPKGSTSAKKDDNRPSAAKVPHINIFILNKIDACCNYNSDNLIS